MSPIPSSTGIARQSARRLAETPAIKICYMVEFSAKVLHPTRESPGGAVTQGSGGGDGEIALSAHAVCWTTFFENDVGASAVQATDVHTRVCIGNKHMKMYELQSRMKDREDLWAHAHMFVGLGEWKDIKRKAELVVVVERRDLSRERSLWTGVSIFDGLEN
uniref:Uncharacterized protein n=1 Tax=Anopheles merus TaxID=30066 RepID=A0A182V172_ANOME